MPQDPPSTELQMNSQSQRNYDLDPDLDPVETQSRPKPGPRGPGISGGAGASRHFPGLGKDPSEHSDKGSWSSLFNLTMDAIPYFCWNVVGSQRNYDPDHLIWDLNATTIGTLLQNSPKSCDLDLRWSRSCDLDRSRSHVAFLRSRPTVV